MKLSCIVDLLSLNIRVHNKAERIFVFDNLNDPNLVVVIHYNRLFFYRLMKIGVIPCIQSTLRELLKESCTENQIMLAFKQNNETISQLFNRDLRPCLGNYMHMFT